MNKKIFLEELSDWNTNASFYENEQSFPLQNLLLQKRLLTYNLPKQKQNILDLGAGTGYFSYLLTNLGHKVTAVDFSPQMAKIAKKNYPELKYIVASSHSLPFKDEIFNLIIADGVLHHLKAQNILSESIKEIKRVLKPGGYLCIYDRNNNLFSSSLLLIALFGKKILIKLKGGYFPSSATRNEVFFDQKDIESIVESGFIVINRHFISSIPTFFCIVITNLGSYLVNKRIGYLMQEAMLPVVIILERFFACRLMTMEQCLKLQKTLA